MHAKTWKRRVMNCAQQDRLSNDCGEGLVPRADGERAILEALGLAGVFMLKIIFIFLTGNFPAVYMQAEMVVFREFLTYMLAATAIFVD